MSSNTPALLILDQSRGARHHAATASNESTPQREHVACQGSTTDMIPVCSYSYQHSGPWEASAQGLGRWRCPMGAEARLGCQGRFGWNGTSTSWKRVMLGLGRLAMHISMWTSDKRVLICKHVSCVGVKLAQCRGVGFRGCRRVSSLGRPREIQFEYLRNRSNVTTEV